MEFAQASCVCPVHCPTEGLQERQQSKKLRRYGLLTLKVGDNFRPKNERAVPPGAVDSLPMNLTRQWAALFNASQYARDKGRWAVIALNGCMHYVKVDDSVRPANPFAFPPGVEVIEGHNWGHVEWIASQRNVERFKVAQVPREWTIPLQDLTTVDPIASPGPIEQAIQTAMKQIEMAPAC